jgi:hypothetical protein
MQQFSLLRRLNTSGGPDACWPWTGPVNGSGYAMVDYNGRQETLQRAIYMEFVGPIPPGWVVDHKCRMRRCGNWRHLEAVTQSINLKRSPLVGRGTAPYVRPTHCPQGHPYAGDNLLQTKDGKLRCRICNIAACRRSRSRKKS